MTTVELRYVGNRTISFLNPPIGEVNPGDVFHVEQEADAEAFLARADVEEADAQDGPPEDTEEQSPAESPADRPEVEETPTERQDEARKSPAPRKRAASKTDNES